MRAISALGFARSDLKRAAHDLDEGQERRLLAVGRAASRQDEGLLLADALAELVAAAATCPCPARPRRRSTRSSPRASARRALQNFQFALAPDIGAEAPPDRRLEPRRALTDGIEPIDLLRLGLALDRVRAGEGRLDQPLHEALRRFAQIDGSRLGQRLQSRGEIHRVAERRQRAAFAANLRDHREARN